MNNAAKHNVLLYESLIIIYNNLYTYIYIFLKIELFTHSEFFKL
jgi:hypothetical protein